MQSIEKKKPKKDISNYPTFKEKLELILEILKVLVNLSLFEGNFSDNKKKDNCIEKYNNLFKEMDCEIFLENKDSFEKKFFSYIVKDMKFVNNYLVKGISTSLIKITQFLKGVISIDEFLDELCSRLKNTIKFIKEIKGNNYSLNNNQRILQIFR